MLRWPPFFLSGLCDRERTRTTSFGGLCFLSGLCDREHVKGSCDGVIDFLSGLCDRELDTV